MQSADKIKQIGDGCLVMVRGIKSPFPDKTYNVIGPIIGGYVPILIPEGQEISKFSVDELGPSFNIDCEKYKGKFFLRIPVSEIIRSTLEKRYDE